MVILKYCPLELEHFIRTIGRYSVSDTVEMVVVASGLYELVAAMSFFARNLPNSKASYRPRIIENSRLKVRFVLEKAYKNDLKGVDFKYALYIAKEKDNDLELELMAGTSWNDGKYWELEDYK